MFLSPFADLFFRPINPGLFYGAMASFSDRAIKSGFIPGALVGTIEVPLPISGESMVSGVMASDGTSFGIDFSNIKLVDNQQGSDIGSLPSNPIWQSSEGGFFQAFIRECRMQSTTHGMKTMLVTSAGFFPKTLAGESIHRFVNGKLSKTLSVKDQVRGMALAFVLKQPFWGTDSSWGFPGTMHLSILDLLDEKVLLETKQSDEMTTIETKRFIEIKKTLGNLGLMAEVKDPDFLRFRAEMQKRCPLASHSIPLHANDIAKRDRIAGEVIRESMAPLSPARPRVSL